MDIGRAQIPVPSGSQAPTTPGDMAALALRIDKFLAHPVEDKAERDARFAGADPGTVVFSMSDGTMWGLVEGVGGNTWVTIHEEPEPWRNLPLAAGFTAGEEAPKIRRVGKQVFIRGRTQRTDGGLITSGGDLKVAQVPDDCIPVALASGAAGQTLAGDPVIGLGRVEVLPHGWERAAGGPGSVIWFSQDPPGSPWVGVDLSYWID